MDIRSVPIISRMDSVETEGPSFSFISNEWLRLLPELQKSDSADLGESNDTNVMDTLGFQLNNANLDRFQPLPDAYVDSLNVRASLNTPTVERPLTPSAVDELRNIPLRHNDSIETLSVVNQSSGAKVPEYSADKCKGLDNMHPCSQLSYPDRDPFLPLSNADDFDDRASRNTPTAERAFTPNTVDELRNIPLRRNDSLETLSVGPYFVGQSSDAEVPEYSVHFNVTDDDDDVQHDECKVMGIVAFPQRCRSTLRQHELEHNYCERPWIEGGRKRKTASASDARKNNNESCRRFRQHRKQRSEEMVALRKTLKIKNAMLRAEIHELKAQMRRAYELLIFYSPGISDKS